MAPTAKSPSLACSRYPIALLPASLNVDRGEVARRAESAAGDTDTRPPELAGRRGTGEPVIGVPDAADNEDGVVSDVGGGDVSRTGPGGGDEGPNNSYDGGGLIMIWWERL